MSTNTLKKPIVKIHHVKKDFGNVAVLKDISLEISRGSIYTLLGENGAGKTTLIEIMTTLLEPDSGNVEINGISLKKQPDKVRELISLNAQETTLDIGFSGYENLLLIAKLRDVKNIKEEIKRISTRLALDDFLHRKVADYSGGMRRRLDIAMSLLGDPEIIFLDEPTTGVDPKSRLEIWRIIQEIRDSGKTVFLTTQYLEEADRLSDEIAFLHQGKIVLTGTPDELKKNTEKLVEITLNKEESKTAYILLENQGIPCSANESGIVLSEEASTNALKVLVNSGTKINKIIPKEVNLETIFLNITDKERI